MNDSNYIVSYTNFFGEVVLYNDRIEHKLPGKSPWSTYPYEEIRSIVLCNALLVSSLTLELWNSGNDIVIAMSKKDSIACKSQLEQLVRNSQLSSGDADIVSAMCTFLGGSGTSLNLGSICLVVFSKDTVSIIARTKITEIKLDQLTTLKLESPGQNGTNTGMLGGGFGIDGAIPGVGAAALLNKLMTNTKKYSMLHIVWPGAEIFLHTYEYSPDEARLVFSHAFMAVNSSKNYVIDDLATQLERLVALRNSGALTDDEYKLCKSKLL